MSVAGVIEKIPYAWFWCDPVGLLALFVSVSSGGAVPKHGGHVAASKRAVTWSTCLALEVYKLS